MVIHADIITRCISANWKTQTLYKMGIVCSYGSGMIGERENEETGGCPRMSRDIMMAMDCFGPGHYTKPPAPRQDPKGTGPPRRGVHAFMSPAPRPPFYPSSPHP